MTLVGVQASNPNASVLPVVSQPKARLEKLREDDPIAWQETAVLPGPPKYVKNNVVYAIVGGFGLLFYILW